MTDRPTTQGAENRIHQLSVSEHELRGVRELASDEAVSSIRRLEKLLQAALQKGKLRGCPNLVPDWSSRAPSTGSPGSTSAFLAWRLRGDGSAPLGPVTLAGGGVGHASLVLTEKGKLMMARRHLEEDDRRFVYEQGPIASDFRSGDLIAFVELLEQVLPIHIARAEVAKAPHVQAIELGKILRSTIASAVAAGVLEDV